MDVHSPERGRQLPGRPRGLHAGRRPQPIAFAAVGLGCHRPATVAAAAVAVAAAALTGAAAAATSRPR